MKLQIMSSEDVNRALPMKAAVEAMKEAFKQISAGRAVVPLRATVEIPSQDATTLFMPALLADTKDLGIKIVSVFPNNAARGLTTIHALVVMLDAETGAPLAIMEGASLTAIRTGAASGAATDVLARHDATTLGLFGSGTQARTHLEAICTVRSIDQIWLYSLDEPSAKMLIQDMSGRGPIPAAIKLVDDPRDAVVNADIICTATTSSTPVFQGADLRPGTHINAIGAFTPTMREVDSETILRSTVVVDSISAALAEAGDIIIPIQEGLVDTEWIHAELGEIIMGEVPGRTDADQITLFKSVGVAVQDVIAARYALAGAAAKGLRRTLEL